MRVCTVSEFDLSKSITAGLKAPQSSMQNVSPFFLFFVLCSHNLLRGRAASIAPTNKKTNQHLPYIGVRMAFVQAEDETRVLPNRFHCVIAFPSRQAARETCGALGGHVR